MHALNLIATIDRICIFGAEKKGNVAPIFALALVPVVGLMGAAVDYSRANAIKTAMQAAVDATALGVVKSAASLTSSQLSQQATNTFNALFTRSDAQLVEVTAQYNSEKKSVTMA